MKLNNGILSALLGFVCIGTFASPSCANTWDLGDYTITVVEEGNDDGAGYGYGGNTTAGITVSAISDILPAGFIANGGARITVSRQFTEIGSAADRVCLLTMDVYVGAGINVACGGSGYAEARGTANGTASFPTSRVLDKTARAALPAGPGVDSKSDSNQNDTLSTRERTITQTTTLQGTIYAIAESGTNQNTVTNQGSSADTTIHIQ